MDFRKLTAAGVISLAILMLFIFVWPAFDKIGLLRVAVQERQTTLKQRESLVNKVKQWRTQQGQQQTKIDRLSTLLPNQKNSEEILISLERVAGQAGIVMRDLNLSASILNATEPQVLLADIKSGGQYANFRDWLVLLEKNLRLADVQEFSLGKDQTTGALNFELKFNTYYLNK